MPIVSIHTDPASLTLTAIGEYPVPVERLWQAWGDPRQIERFWGPPEWPATFTRHDMRAGGRSEYFMTGPNGETFGGYWVFEAVDAPRSFEVRDGFTREDGTPDHTLPVTRMRFEFEPTAQGSRFVSVSTFASQEDLNELLGRGMEEGFRAALSQLDDVLRPETAASPKTRLEVIDDTHVRITREIQGALQEVWEAHQEPERIRRWMLGPDGWSMSRCEPAKKAGEPYHYEWVDAAGGNRFGLTGLLLEMEPPRRAVTTERLAGTEGPSTLNELILTPRPGGRTLITVEITYPSRELRDQILGTGMAEGMEASYARLEGMLAEPALA